MTPLKVKPDMARRIRSQMSLLILEKGSRICVCRTLPAFAEFKYSSEGRYLPAQLPHNAAVSESEYIRYSCPLILDQT